MLCKKCGKEMYLEEFVEGYSYSTSYYICENCEMSCNVEDYNMGGDESIEWIEE